MPIFKKTLKDRIDSYRASTNHLVLPRLPLILTINGKGFSKLTSLLEKPEDTKLSQCFHSTAIRLCSEIEGAVFAFHFNDEIVILMRTDQTQDTSPWMNGNIKKIVSFASSLATSHFDDCVSSIGLNLSGDPLFLVDLFQVPDLVEAENVFVFKQQGNFFLGLQFACLYELMERGFDKEEVKEMLIKFPTIEEKVELLREKCGIDFENYSKSFKNGSGIYKAPRLDGRGLIKQSWVIDDKLPIFTEEPDFLRGIIEGGKDVWRRN